MDTPAPLDAKVAVVTGAGSGIGRVTARLFSASGAFVVVADIDLASATETADLIVQQGGESRAVAVDVSSEHDVAAMIGLAGDAFGGVDILFNNAAATGPDVIGRDGDLIEMDVAVWDATMAVNVRGPMLGCKHAIPVMLARGGGAIVNASSIAGFGGNDRRAAYGTSKAALIGFTRYVATMYGKGNIRCNNVAPSLVMTPAARAHLTPENLALAEEMHLTPGLAGPEDIARAVLFLVSDASRYITGQTLLVDGGMLSHLPSYPPR